MTPFYDDGQVTIYHGDMLTMPPVMSDMFVTDPPYARAGGVHTGRSSIEGSMADAGGADQFWLYWFSSVAARLAGQTAQSGCGFVFCDYRTVHLVERAFSSTESGWVVSQCLVWDRESTGLGSPFRASHELIAFCRGPAFRWSGRRDITNVLRYRWPYGEHPNHPAEKPVGLLRFLIEEASFPGALIFDPFAGSGSTLVAASQCGRRAIGVEIETANCARAVERLRQGVLL